MSITLDLPPELERSLAAEASRKGLPMRDYILDVLKTSVRPRVSAMGMLKECPGSAEEFLREKRAEKEREARQMRFGK